MGFRNGEVYKYCLLLRINVFSFEELVPREKRTFLPGSMFELLLKKLRLNMVRKENPDRDSC